MGDRNLPNAELAYPDWKFCDDAGCSKCEKVHRIRALETENAELKAELRERWMDNESIVRQYLELLTKVGTLESENTALKQREWNLSHDNAVLTDRAERAEAGVDTCGMKFLNIGYGIVLRRE